jgi:hypothetical protein
MPKPARDRTLLAKVRPATRAREDDLKHVRQAVKASGGELWDVVISDLGSAVEPGVEFPPPDDDTPTLVRFLLVSRPDGELYFFSWSITGWGPVRTTKTRTPLQTLAKAALFAVEDALDVRDAHGPDGKLTHNPLPPEVVYQAAVPDGKLTEGYGHYLVVDGQVQDVGGPTTRPRPTRRTSTMSHKLEERARRAAEVYRDALRHGSRHPTQDVARRLHLSRSTAARALDEARRQGLLGPARRTSAGER